MSGQEAVSKQQKQLWEDLVPTSGNSHHPIGEFMRAHNHIIYRHSNDGDDLQATFNHGLENRLWKLSKGASMFLSSLIETYKYESYSVVWKEMSHDGDLFAIANMLYAPLPKATFYAEGNVRKYLKHAPSNTAAAPYVKNRLQTLLGEPVKRMAIPDDLKKKKSTKTNTGMNDQQRKAAQGKAVRILKKVVDSGIRSELMKILEEVSKPKPREDYFPNAEKLSLAIVSFSCGHPRGEGYWAAYNKLEKLEPKMKELATNYNMARSAGEKYAVRMYVLDKYVNPALERFIKKNDEHLKVLKRISKSKATQEQRHRLFQIKNDENLPGYLSELWELSSWGSTSALLFNGKPRKGMSKAVGAEILKAHNALKMLEDIDASVDSKGYFTLFFLKVYSEAAVAREHKRLRAVNKRVEVRERKVELDAKRERRELMAKYTMKQLREMGKEKGVRRKCTSKEEMMRELGLIRGRLYYTKA